MPSRHPAAVTVRGIWWRHTPAGLDPLHLATPPASNRWQRGGRIAGLYLADSRETVWAEWYRHLAERAQPPLDELPRALWRFAVDLEQVADLSDAAALAGVGLGGPRPTIDDWAAYQAVGEQLFVAGFRALLAPSAARPSGRVLCVFRAVPHPPGVRPCPPPERIDVPPAPPRGMTT